MIRALSSSLQELHSKADSLAEAVKSIQDMLTAQQQQQQQQQPPLPEVAALPTVGARVAPEAEFEQKMDGLPPLERAGGWRTKRGAAKPITHVKNQHQSQAVAAKQSRLPASAIAPAVAPPLQPAGKESGVLSLSHSAASDDVPRHKAAKRPARQPLQLCSPQADHTAGCAADAAGVCMTSAPPQSGGGSSIPESRAVPFDKPTHAAGPAAMPKQACQAAAAGDKPAAAAPAAAAAKPASSCQTAASGARGNLDGWLTPVRKRNRTTDANTSKIGLGAKVSVPCVAILGAYLFLPETASEFSRSTNETPHACHPPGAPWQRRLTDGRAAVCWARRRWCSGEPTGGCRRHCTPGTVTIFTNFAEARWHDACNGSCTCQQRSFSELRR